MELKVYRGKEKKEKPIYFKLSEYSNNLVILTVVDETGMEYPGGSVLSISPDGLYLRHNVNKNIGLPLDEKGRIRIRNRNI